MDSAQPALFKPIQIGPYTLKHRIVLAPLSRHACTKDHVPQDIMAEYYSQRASTPGTLLIAEATLIAHKAGVYPHVPGIWNEEQIAQWKKVTKAVHSNNSYIFLQLAALGRATDIEALHASNPDFPLVSASDIPIHNAEENRSLQIQPRPLTKDEIQEYVGLYASAASNAVHKAGFDGVEIHSTNGLLIDQFLQDVSNHRTDVYGGSVENRAKFALEVTKAVIDAVGQNRTGMRIGPWYPYNDMGMINPIPTFFYLVSQLKELYPEFAYLHVIEPSASHSKKSKSPSNNFIRDIWLPRPLISNGRYNRDIALKVAEEANSRVKMKGLEGSAGGELIAFGKPFLANPDLPLRLKQNLPPNHYDSTTFCILGDTSGKGYTDYPFHNLSKL